MPGSGYCECGCGQLTNLAKGTDKRVGHIKGQPVRYIRGHTQSGKKRPRTREHVASTIMSKIRYENGHFIFTGHITKDGYGRVNIEARRHMSAHKAYFVYIVGIEIPDDWDVHHECNDKRCMNPAHLEILPKAKHMARHGREYGGRGGRAGKGKKRKYVYKDGKLISWTLREDKS